MTILEGFAHKKPVITSYLGAMQSLIDHERNDLLFTTKQTDEFINCINMLVESKTLSIQLTESAFQDFKNHYSQEKNYETLIEVYVDVLSKKN